MEMETLVLLFDWIMLGEQHLDLDGELMIPLLHHHYPHYYHLIYILLMNSSLVCACDNYNVSLTREI